MMSASPAWKPQAIFTDVASSVMAASLPISHAPNPSPRSQLRSIVVMMIGPLPVSGSLVRLVRPRCVRRRRNLPCPGIDGADGAAGNISISERVDVETGIVDGAQPVWQGAQ